MSGPSTVERAYQLARSGSCASVSDIRAKLRAERCEAVDEHLRAPTLNRHLRDLCRAAVGATAGV